MGTDRHIPVKSCPLPLQICNTLSDSFYENLLLFPADDGQINLEKENYLVIGTLESYEQMKKYFGEDALLPIYVQVEDGARLGRALERERRQQIPKYEELCRRFLADSQDFSEENIARAGIETRFENVELESCVSEILQFVKERVI